MVLTQKKPGAVKSSRLLGMAARFALNDAERQDLIDTDWGLRPRALVIALLVDAVIIGIGSLAVLLMHRLEWIC